MTPQQEERVRAKITKIKRALAAEKRKFGDYMDSRGLRYAPPELYLRIKDYKGALTYFRWFDKNFPDDIGMPAFLFEWTIALFKREKSKEARAKAFQTFTGNVYLFDRFFGTVPLPLDIWHGSNLARVEYTKYLPYQSTDPELADFSEWLRQLREEPDFKTRCVAYVEIHRQLLKEDDFDKRGALLQRDRELRDFDS